jgi:hypothetical protein
VSDAGKGNPEDSHSDSLGGEHTASSKYPRRPTAVTATDTQQPSWEARQHPPGPSCRHHTRRWTEDEVHDMSHALLLRLFLAPSFFTVHVALQYLALYSDNIGITYYLTRRLNEIDPRELRDVWGFIW